MKTLFRAIKSHVRSDFAARGDALRAESRAEVAKLSSEGRAWDGMRANVALMGMRSHEGSRTRIVSLGTR